MTKRRPTRETKYVFPSYLAQICSAVSEIFDSQTKKQSKKWQTRLKTERYAVYCVR